MTGNYKPLETAMLTEEVALDRPPLEMPASVKLSDPAMNVITDLSKVAAMTINPCASMDEANERMIASNVRLLFVTDQYYRVMGIVTSRDLLGDRAIKYMQEHGGRREDIMVRDIMTPRHKIEVLNVTEVEHARVGDIVETLRRSGRQHALVMRTGSDGINAIAGVVSTTQVSKQTGVEISVAGVASTIADLAARL
jgi:CBS domain containing-hemolysin-like protein